MNLKMSLSFLLSTFDSILPACARLCENNLISKKLFIANKSVNTQVIFQLTHISVAYTQKTVKNSVDIISNPLITCDNCPVEPNKIWFIRDKFSCCKLFIGKQ